MFDSAVFRQVMGYFPTGVVVIAATGASGPVGMSIGSFASVSLDPPLVAFFCGKNSTTWPLVEESGSFVANVLAADQEQLSRLFASKGEDKYAGLDWVPAESGSPILPGVTAWIDCDIEQVYPAGDHWCVFGSVRDLAAVREDSPLIFLRGGYGSLQP